jgi:acyl-CoA reductase-like NAD-dependent aldehyde dehydrogenase
MSSASAMASEECGQVLASHPLVRKVTLIGSVATGKAILRSAADTVKPALLELGGKNALVAYPDADLEALVQGAVRGMNFTWAGQSCGSTSRVFLHESIHDEVLARIAESGTGCTGRVPLAARRGAVRNARVGGQGDAPAFAGLIAARAGTA